MRTHFISRLALLILGAFGVIVTLVWTGGALEWLFFAGGVLMILIAVADSVRPAMIQRAINGLVVLLGAWTIVESLVLNGSQLRWWSFGIACALAALSVVGLTVHELTTERVVHELDVTTTHRHEETPLTAA